MIILDVEQKKQELKEGYYEKSIDSLEKLDKEIDESFNELNLKKETDNNEPTFEELREGLKEVESASKKLEVNNIAGYELFLRRKLKDLKEENSKNNEKEITRYSILLEDLHKIPSLSFMKDCPIKGKYDKKKFVKLQKKVIEKLDYDMVTQYTNPELVRTSLKNLNKYTEDEINIFMFRLYTTISYTNIVVHGNLIYFTLIALSSVHEEEMRGREEVIQSIDEVIKMYM